MTPEPADGSGSDRVEAALAVALERLEREGRISEGWLVRSFPDCWGEVADLLALDARAAGGRNPSSRLGPWRLRRLLGQGGMGTVFLAEATAPVLGLPVGAFVAVKVVHPHLLARPEALARLRREAEAGRRIRHPSVVTIHGSDTIETPEGAIHLLAMDFVEGRTLRERLDAEGPLPEAALRLVAFHALEGLAAIHAAGIVHRDVKPDNLVEREDGRICLVDLGLAFIAEERARLSRTGQFIGSLAYAAPEQVATGHADPDPRVDLFSLGVTLHELATARLPWPEASMASAVYGPSLGTCPVRLTAPGLSAELAAFVDDLLELVPAHRPPSASEALERLRAFPVDDRSREVGGGGGGVGLEDRIVPALHEAALGRGACVVVAMTPLTDAQAAAGRLQARALRSGFEVRVVDGARGAGGFAALFEPADAAPPAPLDLDRLRLAVASALTRRPDEAPLLVLVTSLHRSDAAGLSLWWTCVDAAPGRRIAVLGTSDGEGLPRLADGMRRRPHVICVPGPSAAPASRSPAPADDDLLLLRALAGHPEGADAAGVARSLGLARWTVALALARLHAGGLGLSEHGGVYRLSPEAAARFA